jgi:hypothetical protein
LHYLAACTGPLAHQAGQLASQGYRVYRVADDRVSP